MSKVGIVPDLHCPALQENFLDWMFDMFYYWDVDRIVCIGDLIDNHALSLHKNESELTDIMVEREKTQMQLQQLFELCDEGLWDVDWLIGNHDCLHQRWAKEVGIPVDMLRDYKAIWQVPEAWKIHPRFHQLVIDDIIYQHGDASPGGKFPALAAAGVEFKKVVQGHFHAAFGVQYASNRHDLIWGMQVGCGTDWKHPAMNYGIKYARKPILGCGVVIDGEPHVIPFPHGD